MLDSNLMLIESAADVEATVTGTGVKIGPSVEDETWLIYVPSKAGTTPTLVVTIEESADNSSWTQTTSLTVSAAGQYFQTVKSNKDYRRAVLTVGGTTPNWGKVMVGRVSAGQYKNW